MGEEYTRGRETHQEAPGLAMAMRRGGAREAWITPPKANAGSELVLIQRKFGILFLGENIFPNWTTLNTIITLVNERECRRL